MSAIRIHSLAEQDPELDPVNQAARRIACSECLSDVLNATVDFVTSVVNSDCCVIYVLEEQDLVLRAFRNRPAHAADRLKLKIAQLVAGWGNEERPPVVLNENADQDARFKQFNPGSPERCDSFLSVPVIARGRLVGAINAQSPSNARFTEHAMEMIATVAFLVGTEIVKDHLQRANDSLSEKLEARSVIDQAKRILQWELTIGEDAAYTTMRRQSRETSKSMKEIAEAIIMSYSVRNNSLHN